MSMISPVHTLVEGPVAGLSISKESAPNLRLVVMSRFPFSLGTSSTSSTNPLGRVKLVYPGTLEQICNYQVADFFIQFFFDNLHDALVSTGQRPFDFLRITGASSICRK